MSTTTGSVACFSPVVQFREGELATGLMMFAYSFLAMTAYNVVKPITRSKFISSLGADNLPYVQLAAGLLIGVLMQGYSVARRAPAPPLRGPADPDRDVRRSSSASGSSSGPRATGSRWASTCWASSSASC